MATLHTKSLFNYLPANATELGIALVITLAIVGGGALVWNQVAPWIVTPPPPVEATSVSQEIFRRDDGVLVERFIFDAHVEETCEDQTFRRAIRDTANGVEVPPRILASDTPPGQYFEIWLPPGDAKGLAVEVEVEPGRAGYFQLDGQADGCRSGFKGIFPVYSYRIDWSLGRLEDLGLRTKAPPPQGPATPQ